MIVRTPEQFRQWILEHIHQMDELARHPNPDEATLSYCGRIVRVAGAHAAQFGFVEAYQRCRVMGISPEEAKGHLAACLSWCGKNPTS